MVEVHGARGFGGSWVCVGQGAGGAHLGGLVGRCVRDGCVPCSTLCLVGIGDGSYGPTYCGPARRVPAACPVFSIYRYASLRGIKWDDPNNQERGIYTRKSGISPTLLVESSYLCQTTINLHSKKCFIHTIIAPPPRGEPYEKSA